MQVFSVDWEARSIERETTESGALVLRLHGSDGQGGRLGGVADRLGLAVKWAVDMDAHFRELIVRGHRPHVFVPAGQRIAGTRRVKRDSIAEYRKLRMGVGEMVRPLLMDPPQLCDLFPFQRRGVKWLCRRDGGILADDMGLGKTVQVIAAIRVLFNHGILRSTLVVCPRSLVSTWSEEFRRWAPELGVAVLAPSAPIREEAWRIVCGNCHILLTNYEQLREPPAALVETKLDLVVADEAHRLRNHISQVSRGIGKLTRKRFWALTGTPLERDLQDLATLLSIVLPDRFAPTDGKLHPASLRSQARRYILRRRKDEILNDLPPVFDTIETLELSAEQKRGYREAISEYRRRGKAGDALALLVRLQLLCDIDPRSRESSKVDRIIGVLARIRELGEKAVVFSYRLEPLRELQSRVTDLWGTGAAVSLVGKMPSEERDRCIREFRGEERALVLLASTRVGGEGYSHFGGGEPCILVQSVVEPVGE